MFGYAIEFAFGRRGLVAARAATPAQRTRVLVGAGGPSGDAPVSPAGPVGAAAGTGTGAGGGAPITGGRAAWFGRFAVAAAVLGALAQIGCLAARGIAAGRVPWGNMYEFVSVACVVGTITWLVVSARRPVRYLGMFVMLPVVLLLGLAGTVLYVDAGPLMPALNSYWLWIHVSAASISVGIYLTAGVIAILYLLREGYDRRIAAGRPAKSPGFPFGVGRHLPAADGLERLSFRLHAFGFPIWTFAIICGAIWAEAAWSRYWGWDPKETWAFISWVVYAAYLHARATTGWRGRRAALIAVLGFITMMINLYVINFAVSGLHSYSGL
ncbi:c-type cytochrome biogenesis protein CcsB [Cryptosporangium phraense]|uniref:C-type cytochrome biogenesis protein CcsB n=2 Tax=Cryptosporangium phraense TaxID=2593070 RepID=A0A545AEL8_9ACTN|nr:c-type cytochrome biogenesis protein CcsB [Cryptosporangium phraense]